MALLDVFIGSMQSRYAAMAIIASLLAVALIVVFSKEKIGFGKKLTPAVHSLFPRPKRPQPH